jgi:CBS domain-containing protein
MGLYQKLREEPIANLDLRDLITVAPTGTVRAAVALMQEGRVGCVAVVDPEGRPIGAFTERLLMKLVLDNPSAMDEPLSDHMVSPWTTVTRSDTIARLIDLMESEKLRFVCVVDDQGRAAALVGQKGVVAYLADQFPREVKGQDFGTKMHMDQREGA